MKTIKLLIIAMIMVGVVIGLSQIGTSGEDNDNEIVDKTGNSTQCEIDTVEKINPLIAKLDSISISYRDIKALRNLNLQDDMKRKVEIIDAIFTALDEFNPNPKPKQDSYSPEIWAEKMDRYFKQFADFYAKINPLKNEFFKDELKDLGRDKINKETNWIIVRMDRLKPKGKLRENATLEDIFTKKKK
jgi:hypothetical protein